MSAGHSFDIYKAAESLAEDVLNKCPCMSQKEIRERSRTVGVIAGTVSAGATGDLFGAATIYSDVAAQISLEVKQESDKVYRITKWR